METWEYIAQLKLLEIGGIVFLLGYIFIQFFYGRRKGTNDLINDLKSQLSAQDDLIKRYKVDIDFWKDKYEDLKRGRDPQLIQLEKSNHDILLQVQKTLQHGTTCGTDSAGSQHKTGSGSN